MSDASVVVYLIRHGRTELNAVDFLRGRLDPPLDDIGRAEAAALGAVFHGVRLTAVVSSPLRRALETAQPIVDSSGAQLLEDELLVDRDYGPWAGQPRSEVIARFGSLDDATGVEASATFFTRVSTAVRAIADKWSPGPVAIVAHDAVNRYAIAALVPSVGDPETIPQRTGCWNRLERRDALWFVPEIDAIPDDGRRP